MLFEKGEGTSRVNVCMRINWSRINMDQLSDSFTNGRGARVTSGSKGASLVNLPGLHIKIWFIRGLG